MPPVPGGSGSDTLTIFNRLIRVSLYTDVLDRTSRLLTYLYSLKNSNLFQLAVYRTVKVCSGIEKGVAKFSSSPSSSHDAPRCQDIVIYSKIKFVTLTLIRSCSILLTSKPLDQCCGFKSIEFESGSRILAPF